MNLYPRSQSKYARETALIVNSEPQNREAMQDFLRGAQYHVLFAATADEAMELCRNYEGPIHLLVTDDDFPETSGWELAERAGKIRPGLLVLFLSRETMAASAQRTEERGDCHLGFDARFTPRVLQEVAQALANTRRN